MLAWAYERENGGRSFAYSGGHFLAAWDNEQARKTLLNAIFWTAGRDVPDGGVRTTIPADAGFTLAFPNGHKHLKMDKAIVSRKDQIEVIDVPWGQIEWFVSGKLKNSTTMTVGLATVATWAVKSDTFSSKL